MSHILDNRIPQIEPISFKYWRTLAEESFVSEEKMADRFDKLLVMENLNSPSSPFSKCNKFLRSECMSNGVHKVENDAIYFHQIKCRQNVWLCTSKICLNTTAILCNTLATQTNRAINQVMPAEVLKYKKTKVLNS